MDHDGNELTSDNGLVYRRLSEMTANGEPGVLATVIATRKSTPRHAGAKMIIHRDGSVTGSVGGGRAEALVIDEARKLMGGSDCRTLKLDLAEKLGVCGGDMDVFLEPVLRGSQFVVIGAGHVGRALVALGRSLPFRFLVVDDRDDWLEDLGRKSDARTWAADPDQLAADLDVVDGAMMLVASRNHELDAAYVRAILAAERRCDGEYAFLGVLGSRRKISRLEKMLLDDGRDPDRIARMQMPVGLDLGAETPAEIALSILAEATAVGRGRPPLTDASGQALGVRYHRYRTDGPVTAPSHEPGGK